MMSTEEAVKAAGITYRQCYYWVSHGYVVPTVHTKGSGSLWEWSEIDVLRLGAIGILADAGLRPSAILNIGVARGFATCRAGALEIRVDLADVIRRLARKVIRV